MFKITWDKENNGILLTMKSSDEVLNVPPRPVFFEELDLLRLNKSMILKDWTLNVEYFSEVLHLLRTAPEYSMLVNEVVYSEEKSDLRDLKAVQRIAAAYPNCFFHTLQV